MITPEERALWERFANACLAMADVEEPLLDVGPKDPRYQLLAEQWGRVKAEGRDAFLALPNRLKWGLRLLAE